MRERLLLVGITALLLPTKALAQETQKDSDPASTNEFPGAFTANMGLVSDYIFRGISQTREKPALQGGVDYAHPSGFYLGAWGSNINFGDGDDEDHAHIEIDSYAGYTYTIDKWALDGRFIYYAYPGEKSELDYNYYEINGNVTYDFDIAKLTGSVFYTPDNFAESGVGVYYSLGANVPLANGFGLNGKIGHQTVDNAERFEVPSYTDWSAGITYDWRGATFGLQYTDTNLSKEKCPDDCDAKGIASIAFAF